MAQDSFAHTPSDEIDSWSTLTREGDGYLTQHQRKAFEHAITLVKQRLDDTLQQKSAVKEAKTATSLVNYIDTLEDRFLNDANHVSDMEQEVALTAARLVEKVAQIILEHHPSGLSK
ncbi:hypothetical protein [Marinomonas mediterranea]|jgi:hypothetical protein|uniref:Uncharacterized protein n=1 Tax=Marinomonas mediterranea (strain ATCC 700492 / JCM 21426 / NBRC 103028 / MMB-1) TaxID=717774 RepID=F2JTD8_MARM1|nr:hypothetical protein [Marinomonas mediterranea]ADZ90356.1 hypothetical protein Marme_1081 [Marinomonas mediterranea MMB-1]WCN08413.1 HrpW-specific chaperone [Marinomonas mediterranea]WCN16539.1 HrpW-specific chaperone [Marinomonas mediterranea MMB-1]